MTQSAHSRAFERRIAEHRQSLLEAMALGQDNQTYWRLVGVVQGLGDAVAFSKEIDSILSGEDPNAGR